MPPVGVATPVLARYYDPSTGQFLSVDTDVATTLSPYGYVAGNPLNDTDPTGLGPIQDVQAAIASALASQFNSWSQQVQDQYVKLSNVLKDLQLEQRGLENDDNQLSEAEISDHIEQYEVGDLLANPVFAFLGRTRGSDPVAVRGQQFPHEQGIVLVVVHNQNQRRSAFAVGDISQNSHRTCILTTRVARILHCPTHPQNLRSGGCGITLSACGRFCLQPWF